MPAKLNLTGQKFGRLLVMSEAEKWGRYICWNCLCVCGKSKIATTHDLRSGDTTSCGCYHKEVVANIGHDNKTHGYSKTVEYTIWSAMWQRCTNRDPAVYVRYAGRGITVCKEWESFEKFLADMGKRPSPELTLERVDNNKGYSKDNCKWATRKEQNNNQNGWGFYLPERFDLINKLKQNKGGF